jgi:hypothetical protein
MQVARRGVFLLGGLFDEIVRDNSPIFELPEPDHGHDHRFAGGG